MRLHSDAWERQARHRRGRQLHDNGPTEPVLASLWLQAHHLLDCSLHCCCGWEFVSHACHHNHPQAYRQTSTAVRTRCLAMRKHSDWWVTRSKNYPTRIKVEILFISNLWFLAYIPAPIILSILIDRTCVLWNQECIGDKGTCLEYDARGFHYWLFGASAGIKVFSCVLLVALSVYTHKALILRRKYCSQVTLYHDPSMQPTRKHKSRINSVVASSTNDTDTERETTSSLDSLSYLIRFRRSSNSDSERSQPAGAPSFANNNNNNNNNPPNTRRHTNTANNVVLKRHVVFDDDFTSLARVQTPTEMSLVGDGATPGAVVTGPMSLSSLSSDETDTSPSDQQQQTVTSTTGV